MALTLHRDFVRDDVVRSVQVRIGRIEGDEQVLNWSGLEDFDGRTIFITEIHDSEFCPFFEDDVLPMHASVDPFVIPDE